MIVSFGAYALGSLITIVDFTYLIIIFALFSGYWWRRLHCTLLEELVIFLHYSLEVPAVGALCLKHVRIQLDEVGCQNLGLARPEESKSLEVRVR